MMIFVKIFLLSCCASVAFGGGYSQCEPFYSRYHNFLQNFLESVHKRQQGIMTDVENYPFYLNASVVESEITAENYYRFFINVTAKLANLSTVVVEGVASGEITDVPEPLGCVDGSFSIVSEVMRQMRQKVLNLGITLTTTSPTSASTSNSSNPSNCTDISTLFPIYASQLQQILNKRAELNQMNIQTFAEFTEIVLALNAAQNESQVLFLVTALADALHIDVSLAKELVHGHFVATTTVSPPTN